MERTLKGKIVSARVVTTDEGAQRVIWWRKFGGGSFTAVINGRKQIIKENQKFQATLDEIPKAFRDVVRPLEDLPPGEEENVDAGLKKIVSPVYRKQARGGRSKLFDVVGMNKKPLNTRGLTEEEADELIADLQK